MVGATVSLGKEVNGITHLSLVPTQLKRLLDQDEIASYKHILLGGAHIPSSLFQKP